MPFLDLHQLDIDQKTVLVRLDLNVPLDEEGNITEDSRIIASLPTLQHLLDRNAKVVLMTHMGRPKGQDPKLSTLNIGRRLSRLLFKEVKHINQCVGNDVKQTIKAMKPGEILLLENLRFFEGEKKNDQQFTRQLAELADVYVNECFGVSHREHASMYGLPKLLPSAGGFCLRKEVDTLNKMMQNPKHPFVAVLGGVKADKMDVLKNLLPKVDQVLIGGGLAMLIYKLQGKSVGSSKFDDEWMTEEMQERLKEVIQHPDFVKKVVLPEDCIVAQACQSDVATKAVDKDSIEDGWMALDIGPKTREHFKAVLEKAQTIMWAGPMGVFEIDQFAEGTKMVAKTMASSKGLTVVGGGQSGMAIEQFNLADRVTHVSTGGGAFLHFVSYGSLPGIDVLTDFKEQSQQKQRMEMQTIF